MKSQSHNDLKQNHMENCTCFDERLKHLIAKLVNFEKNPSVNFMLENSKGK